MNRLKKLAEGARGKVLDVGYNLRPNKYLPNPVGIDIETCQRPSWYSATIQADISNSVFQNEIFDTVIAGELLEHLEEPYKFFNEAHRILRKRGRLILSTPNANSVIIAIANWFGIRLPKGHKHEYTKRIVTLMAQETGFATVKLIGLTGLLFFCEIGAYRFNIRIPLWLLPLCHKILYVFEKEE